MKYQFILLDADNTLLDFDKCEKVAFGATMEELGIPFSPILYETYSKINHTCWLELEQGKISRKELQSLRFSRFFASFSFDFNAKKAGESYIAHLSRQGHVLPGALEFLQSLHTKAKIYIVTNGIARVQHSRLQNHPILPYLQDIFISEELGASKPDPLFFERVAEKIPQFDPKKAIVIGDSLSSDILGANNAGIACIWYNPANQTNPNPNLRIDYIVSGYDEILHILEQGDINED